MQIGSLQNSINGPVLAKRDALIHNVAKTQHKVEQIKKSKEVRGGLHEPGSTVMYGAGLIACDDVSHESTHPVPPAVLLAALLAARTTHCASAETGNHCIPAPCPMQEAQKLMVKEVEKACKALDVSIPLRRSCVLPQCCPSASRPTRPAPLPHPLMPVPPCPVATTLLPLPQEVADKKAKEVVKHLEEVRKQLTKVQEFIMEATAPTQSQDVLRFLRRGRSTFGDPAAPSLSRHQCPPPTPRLC